MMHSELTRIQGSPRMDGTQAPPWIRTLVIEKGKAGHGVFRVHSPPNSLSSMQWTRSRVIPLDSRASCPWLAWAMTPSGKGGHPRISLRWALAWGPGLLHGIELLMGGNGSRSMIHSQSWVLQDFDFSPTGLS